MLIYGVIILLFIWLGVVSFILFKQLKRYNHLVSGTKRRRLEEMLDVLIKKQEANGREIASVAQAISELEEKSRLHYQKLGFVRFNPFEKIGGEQSFVTALLDGENNGILLNFLYTREGVRIYAKKLRSGKSDEYELSQEEQEAVKKAM